MASSDTLMEARLQLYEIFLSAAKSMALRAAVLLNIPDIIATHGNGNPLSVQDIASYISAANNKPAQIEYLSRILRFLASIGIFTEELSTVSVGGNMQYKYALTDMSKMLVKKDNPQSFAPTLLVMCNKSGMDAFQNIHESVVEEGHYAFNRVHGMDMWEYLSNDEERNRMFNEGMAAMTEGIMPTVVKMYDAGFKSVRRVVDVGGGTGSALSIIIKENPHISAINFDQPHVIATAPPIPGVEHVGGNMFEHIPPGDVILFKCMLHDWDDEHCVKVLKKSYEATPEDGKVLIVDAVVDDKQGELRRLGLLFDMEMMAYTAGGKERTEEEFKELFIKAGFKNYTVLKMPLLLQALIEVSK